MNENNIQDEIIEHDYGISPATIARTTIFFIGILNFVLARFNILPITISENFIYQTISDLWLIGSGLVCWWKNNAFTLKARVGGVVSKVFNEAVDNKDINPCDNFVIEIQQDEHTELLDFNGNSDSQ